MALPCPKRLARQRNCPRGRVAVPRNRAVQFARRNQHAVPWPWAGSVGTYSVLSGRFNTGRVWRYLASPNPCPLCRVVSCKYVLSKPRNKVRSSNCLGLVRRERARKLPRPSPPLRAHRPPDEPVTALRTPTGSALPESQPVTSKHPAARPHCRRPIGCPARLSRASVGRLVQTGQTQRASLG